MNKTPGLAAGKPADRNETRGFRLESRRWPVEDRQLVQTLFGGKLATELIDAMPQLSYASQTMQDPLVACLSDIRGRYMHVHGLRGQVHFEADTPHVGVPESPLRSILEHLVEGALRDNPAEDPFCHVGVSEKDDESVTLYLRDNGRALPECSLEALRRFVREAKPAQVPDRVYRLFLADNLVQWLGGRMWIGPTPNAKGASVFLRLPRAAGPQQ